MPTEWSCFDKVGVNMKSHKSTDQKVIQEFDLIQREQWKVQPKIQFQNLPMAASLLLGLAGLDSLWWHSIAELEILLRQCCNFVRKRDGIED